MYCATCGHFGDETACPACAAPPKRAPFAPVGTFANWPHRLLATVVDLLLLATFFLVVAASLSLAGVAGYVLFQLLSALYVVVLLTRTPGGTFGNAVVRTCVRDADTGRVLSRQRALTRWTAQWLPVVVAGLVANGVIQDLALACVVVDCAFPLWDVRRQTLHDKVANAVVLVAAAAP